MGSLVVRVLMSTEYEDLPFQRRRCVAHLLQRRQAVRLSELFRQYIFEDIPLPEELLQ